ncbi:hypothetical protein CDD83_3348 [Cordyceps sp. RAO-2017]|nr:hypothetical protein CDD83_3348 [Cordyceps sp. RAO-2017]
MSDGGGGGGGGDDDEPPALPPPAQPEPKAGLHTILAFSVKDGIQNTLHPWLSLLARKLKGPSLPPPDDADVLRPLLGLAPACRRSAPSPVARAVLDILCSSWLNTLLIFVPVGVGSYVAGMSPLMTFATNAAAIVPLSALLTDATERVAAYAGDTAGALLNISLGNLVELILFAALAHGHVRIVEASILGSVLVNLLLILGSALLVGSTVNDQPTYNTADAQLLACLLFVSVFTFLMPTAFDYTFGQEKRSSVISLKLSRISSLLILAIYVLYIMHEIRSRYRGEERARATRDVDVESNLSASNQRQFFAGHPPPPPPLPHFHHSPVPSPRTIRFADEQSALPQGPSAYVAGSRGEMDSLRVPQMHDDYAFDCRGRQRSDGGERRPRANSHQPPMHQRKHSPSLSLRSYHGCLSRDSSVCGNLRAPPRSGLVGLQMLRDGRLDRDPAYVEEEEQTESESLSAVVVSLATLIVTSGLMSVNAELLVDAIDGVTRQTNLSESVIGLIILPIVGNIAEYVTVVAVAARDKMDLAIAVAVGSSIQIALCVTPLTILAGWILQRDLALTFNFFEMATLMGGVLLANLLILNESSSGLRTTGLKGALMCACYLIIA